jgi:hypothetical protein
MGCCHSLQELVRETVEEVAHAATMNTLEKAERKIMHKMEKAGQQSVQTMEAAGQSITHDTVETARGVRRQARAALKEFEAAAFSRQLVESAADMLVQQIAAIDVEGDMKVHPFERAVKHAATRKHLSLGVSGNAAMPTWRELSVPEIRNMVSRATAIASLWFDFYAEQKDTMYIVKVSGRPPHAFLIHLIHLIHRIHRIHRIHLIHLIQLWHTLVCCRYASAASSAEYRTSCHEARAHLVRSRRRCRGLWIVADRTRSSPDNLPTAAACVWIASRCTGVWCVPDRH